MLLATKSAILVSMLLAIIFIGPLKRKAATKLIQLDDVE